jgi:hypothetical protein
VKRIILFLIAAAVVAVGCSKDNTAPSFSNYQIAKKAENVVATYNKDTDEISVTWDMSDTTGVINYYISVSDSSVFNSGRVVERSVNSKSTSFNFPLKDYLADVDSTIIYFDVSAVYKSAKLNYFIGPITGAPDSCMIKR